MTSKKDLANRSVIFENNTDVLFNKNINMNGAFTINSNLYTNYTNTSVYLPSATNVYIGATTTLQTTIQSTGAVPNGIIMMWSGTTATIPSGWHICDGTTVTTSQGVITKPNLRGEFVLGRSTSYAVNSSAGAASLSLTVENIPAHTHVTNETSITPNHMHDLGMSDGGGQGQDLTWLSSRVGSSPGTEVNTDYANHVHAYTTPPGGGVSTGTSVTPISLLPRCYALIYIIKLPA